MKKKKMMMKGKPKSMDKGEGKMDFSAMKSKGKKARNKRLEGKPL